MTAAVLKLSDAQFSDLTLFGSSIRGFTPAVIALEILVGLWFLSGLARRAGRLVALVLLAGFAAVNLWKAAYGEASCGCFGLVMLPPLPVVLAVLPCSRSWNADDTNAAWIVGLACIARRFTVVSSRTTLSGLVQGTVSIPETAPTK